MTLVLIEEALLEDYDVSLASNAGEAFAHLKDHRPDVILLDVELAESSGYELCRAIRARPEHRLTKIAFVSAYTELEKRLEGYDAGADDYLTKPLDVAEIRAKMRVLLRLKTVEEVDSLKKGFLSLISHETMTPLTKIRGYCDALLTDPDIDQAKVHDRLQGISSAADTLTELIQKTMLSTTLNENPRLTRYPLPIKSLISELCEARASAANPRGVLFHTELDAATAAVDPKLFGKAIGYVLDNAVKVSPGGCSVSVTGKLDGESYVLQIADYGPGIPEHFLPLVFEPFAVNDVLHHTRGSGLSLYIAKKILELHYATIEIVNREPAGAPESAAGETAESEGTVSEGTVSEGTGSIGTGAVRPRTGCIVTVRLPTVKDSAD